MIEKNYAFVTVLTTDDYLIGVLSLNESLKRVNSKYPFIVVVNNNVKQETIEKMEKLGEVNAPVYQQSSFIKTKAYNTPVCLYELPEDIKKEFKNNKKTPDFPAFFYSSSTL